MIMRNFLFFCAVLTMFAACQVMNDLDASAELFETQDKQEQKYVSGVALQDVIAVQESSHPSKSTLEVDEGGIGTIYWKPADVINVFYGTASTRYVSKNTENATTAVFKTTDVIGISESSSENIWGLYPYDEDATCTGSSVNTTLPATQYGVSGSFDDDLFITLAHNTSTALVFYNVCGGIKFSLSRDDITSITFQGNNDEFIAGDISLDFVDGVPRASVTNGQKVVTVTPKSGETFAAGEDYYIVLLPNTLTEGFTMTFTTTMSAVGTFNYTEKAVTIKRSVFGKKANIDTYAELPPPNNQIWYTTTNGQVITLNYAQENSFLNGKTNVSIVSNTYSAGRGILTFDDDITIIQKHAFRFCSNLATMILPESVTELGVPFVFGTCRALHDIRLPSGLSSIGTRCFFIMML